MRYEVQLCLGAQFGGLSLAGQTLGLLDRRCARDGNLWFKMKVVRARCGRVVRRSLARFSKTGGLEDLQASGSCLSQSLLANDVDCDGWAIGNGLWHVRRRVGDGGQDDVGRRG